MGQEGDVPGTGSPGASSCHPSAMTNPVVTASLNKAAYAPGETMTLTVNYGDVDNASITLTVVATDAAGNSSAPVTVNANIVDTVTVAVTSSPARTWTKVTDTGVMSVFTAVA